MFSDAAAKKEAKRRREETAQVWDGMDVVISWSDVHKGTKLASGNYGTVYEGTCRGQPVAIKVLHNQELDSEKLEALKKEVDIMRRLRHPKIMLLMGMCVEHGNIAVIMEHIQGKDLADVTSNDKIPLSLEEKLRITKDVAIGINWLHCLQPPIIHRDLKPANIMITKDGDVRICDFGLSCIKEIYDPKAPRKTSAVGTPVWMAPEILCGYPNSEKSDMYAYALVIWELFVRREKPFAEMDDFPTFCRLLVEQQIRPKFSSDVPAAVREFIELCWTQDPKKRPYFKDVLELIDDVITNTLISDSSGKKMWRRISGQGNKFPFTATWKGFADRMSKSIEDFKSDGKAARCLELMLADVQKDVTREKDNQAKVVRIGKFGEFLDLFGPLEKLAKFEQLCKEGGFHGHIDSGESEKRLKGTPKGTYMTRVSGRENSIVLTISLGPDDPKRNLHCRVSRTKSGGYSLKVGGVAREQPDVVSLIKDIQSDLGLTTGLTEGSPYAAIFDESSDGEKEPDKVLYDDDADGQDALFVLKLPGGGASSSSSGEGKKTKSTHGSKRDKKGKKEKKSSGGSKKEKKKSGYLAEI